VNVATAFRQVLKKRGIPPKSLAQALQTLEESALQNMQDFGAQEIANTLHIMAKQRYKATGPLLLALERRAEAISGKFNSQDVAHTLWAFATMGTRPGERMMRQLERQAEAMSWDFNSQAVAKTLWAYATMGMQPGERLMGLMEKQVERAEAMSENFTSQEVANADVDSTCLSSSHIIRSFALYGFQPIPANAHSTLETSCAEKDASILPDMLSTFLATTLWAYATMKRRPGERMMELLEGRVEAISGEFKSQEVSSVLWAYATIQRKPGEQMLRLLELRMEELSGQFSSQNITKLLWAYDMLWASAMIGRKNVLWVYEMMRRKPEERMMKLLERRAEDNWPIKSGRGDGRKRSAPSEEGEEGEGSRDRPRSRQKSEWDARTAPSEAAVSRECSTPARSKPEAEGRTQASNDSNGANFHKTVFRCAACHVDCSGEIVFLQHIYGKAHKARARRTGFAGVIPNDAGIIPPFSNPELKRAFQDWNASPAYHAASQAAASLPAALDASGRDARGRRDGFDATCFAEQGISCTRLGDCKDEHLTESHVQDHTCRKDLKPEPPKDPRRTRGRNSRSRSLSHLSLSLSLSL
jgi:hypothetical protein